MSKLSKTIAAGVTTALLSFGANYSGSYAGRSAADMKYNQKYESRGESKPRYASTYGNELCSWLKDVGYGGTSRLESAFMSTGLSDTEKYNLAMEFYNVIKNGKKGSSNEENKHKHVYWQIYREPNGGVSMLDRGRGVVVASLDRASDGTLYYSGDPSLTEDLGGRGKLSQMMQMAADGDYLNKN